MFKLEWYDIVRLLVACGENEDTAKIVAEYLDECIDYEMNLSHYIWNSLKFNVQVFDTKNEALQYIENELCIGNEEYVLFEGETGVYLEWY